MHSERHDEPTVKPASIANGLAISDKAVKVLVRSNDLGSAATSLTIFVISN